MNNTRRLFALSRAFHTQITRNAGEMGPRSARLKEIQNRLQIDNGVPIHLKAGPGDKILYTFTVVLCAVGLGMSVDTLYKLITGKKA